MIRGLVLTRTVPRGSVAGFSDWPAVVWRSGLPAPQHSRIVAFRDEPLTSRAALEHNAECLARLRRTVPPQPGADPLP